MFVLRRASRGSVQLVVCLWLCSAVFLCTLLKSESLASWASFRSRSILQPSRRLSSLPRRCDPPADALRSTLMDAAAGENAPEGDAPEGSSAEPAADAAAAAGDATDRKGVQDFMVGEVIDGKVRNIAKGVVWVDIGIPKGAWLLGERQQKFKLDVGEQLKGLLVEEVDIVKGWISVTLPDLESRVKDRPSAPSPPPRSKKKAEASPTNQTQSATAGEGSPKTAAIRVGGNTGATKIALGRATSLELMIAGVAVSDLDVDYETGRIVIGLGERAAKAEGPTTQAKAKPPPAKAKPPPAKAKPPPAKAKPPPRQKPPPTAEELADLEDLEVGATLKGKVVTKNRGGCWLDIGKIHEAKVKIPANLSDKLEWGEELDVTISEVNKTIARVMVSISEQEQDKISAREVSKKDMTSFEVGEIVSGHVAQINSIGIFVDVGADRDGLLRRSNSTGSLKNGDKVENLKVVKVNVTARTIALAFAEDSKGSGDDDES